ncbi:MAG TPA: carboxymuconolactone decarboxylase family protein [Anaeromyxobacter sp.]
MATVEKTQQQKRSDVRAEIQKTFGSVPTWVEEFPDAALEGFWSTMRDFQLAETAIPNKYKELIGLGVSGATRCRYCALFHTEAAKLFGATDEEIREAAMMAAHTMSASTFLNAMQTDYDTFRRETLDAISYVRAHTPALQQGQQGQVSKGGTAAHA